MKAFLRILPWALLALFAADIAAVLLPKRDGAWHTREFGRLPVLLNGRVQPFDSVARNALLQIRGTGDLPLEQVPSWQFWRHAKKLRSTEWLLEVMFKAEAADDRPVFLIHHPELLSQLNLQDQGIERSGLRFYTFNQLRSAEAEIRKQGGQASQVDAQARTPLQKQVLKLANAVVLYDRLKNSVRPENAADFAAELAEFEKTLAPGLEAFRAREAGQTFNQVAFDRLIAAMSRFKTMADAAYPLIAPPATPGASAENWSNAGLALLETVHTGQVHPAMKAYAAMATAYRQGRAEAFNRAVTEYRGWLAGQYDRELGKGRAEYYFNQAKPFLHAMIIYLCAFLLAVGALLTWSLAPTLAESLRRSAFHLVILAGLVHTFGLVFRMVLEGRPPVTNLYSSAIFIGWGTMVFGVVLERMFRLGLGSAAAAFAGFITLIIAHNLAIGGDTMEMMRAVLDTNFWLATHVVVITLGYAANFVAGVLAIACILLGLFTSILRMKAGRQEVGAVLRSMVYAVLCFATLFSFVGTVLGGIWADQSWGRFWGWDPKENGALIIVLWNAAVLHARWAGLVRERGLMAMAVFGNIVTSFSWFGVNMLGIGLHSYGFMDAAFKWLVLFILSQLLIIGLALVPTRLWLSYRAQGGAAPAAPAQ